MGVPWVGDAEYVYDAISIGADLRNLHLFIDTKVTVSGELAADVEIKKPKGGDKATLTPKGLVPTQPTVEVMLWTTEHHQTYEALLPEVQPKAGKSALPVVYVVHPDLAVGNLLKFYVKAVTLPKSVGPQMKSFTLKLIEWSPAPSPTSAKLAAKAAGAEASALASGAPADTVNKVTRYFEAQRAAARKLPAEQAEARLEKLDQQEGAIKDRGYTNVPPSILGTGP